MSCNYTLNQSTEYTHCYQIERGGFTKVITRQSVLPKYSCVRFTQVQMFWDLPFGPLLHLTPFLHSPLSISPLPLDTIQVITSKEGGG